MPRTAGKHERPAASDQRRTPKVWRIARFGTRFEMDSGYCRKGGLDYVRMFVTPTTADRPNESTQFMQQLEELDHYYPEQRDAYEGRFWRICRLTATQADWLRGYLLDAERRPLTDGRLAARLHLDVRAMKATLAALRKVGLLEYVPCPEFDHPPERPQEDADEPQEPAKQTKGTRAGAKGKGRKTGSAASIGDDSGTFRNIPEPLCEDELANDKSKLKSNGQKAKGQTKANPKGVGQGQPPTAPTTAPPGGAIPNPGQSTAQGRSGPIPPQDVTDGGPRHSPAPAERKPATAPPRAHEGPNVVRLGDMVHRVHEGLTQGYTLRADAFAEEIFALLRAPFDRDSREGQRERGNYRAALLDCVDAGMPPGAIEEMLAKGRRDAEEIGRHRKRYYRNDGSPEQYWRFRWNQHFAARVPPARAGPASAMG